MHFDLESRCKSRKIVGRGPSVGFCAVWMIVIVAGCGKTASDRQPGAEVNAAKQVDPVVLMRDALRVGQWERARTHSQQALLAHPDDPQVIQDAAKANAMCGNKREAAKLLVDGMALTNYAPGTDVDFAFQALIDVGELYEAIELLERTVSAHPEDHQHRRMLVGMLGEAQRTERIGAHYETLIRERAFDFPLLVAISEATTRRFYPKSGDLMMERNPTDHRVRLGEARNHVDLKEVSEARRVLDEILQHHPDFAPAYALLGQVLVEQQQLDEIPQWFQDAPAGSDEFPDYWLTLGDWATNHDQQPEAARAYWEATRRDPNDPNAWSRLALTLRRISSVAADQPLPFTEKELSDMDKRVADLLEMRKHLFGFDKSGRKSQRYAIETAKNLESLGRNWEAEAWSAAATTLKDDPSDEIEPVRQSIIQQLRQDPSWLSTVGRPALKLELSEYPMPRLSREGAVSRITAVIPEIESSEHVRLRDASETWGLSGIGKGNYASDARLGPLIRSTGVGGGAIDYDLDGHPDALVMGAGGTMLKQDSFTNELLRNVGDRFERVTDFARQWRHQLWPRPRRWRLQ